MNLTWAFPFPFITRPAARPAAQPKPKYHRHPAPAELFNKTNPGKRYQGYLVAWDVTIRTIYAEISQFEILVLASDEGQTGNIWLTVDIREFPEILSCPSGSAVLVKAEVSSVWNQDIYLENCKVKL